MIKLTLCTMSDEFPMDQNGNTRELLYQIDEIKDRIDQQLNQYEEDNQRWDILTVPEYD